MKRTNSLLKDLTQTSGVSLHLWIEQVLKDVVEDMSADESVFFRYFSKDYIQHVDGKTLYYPDFVQHMQAQKQILEHACVTVERSLAEGNCISTIHRVDAVKKTGQRLSVKVIAHFEVYEGKIIFCDELTHLLSGEKEDQRIGSCTHS